MVLCAMLDESSCGSCGVSHEGCCPHCCPEEECVQCLVDPCQGYSCQGFPGYTCKSNYCGGCNREWFTSSGDRTECAVEIFVHLPFPLSLSPLPFNQQTLSDRVNMHVLLLIASLQAVMIAMKDVDY